MVHFWWTMFQESLLESLILSTRQWHCMPQSFHSLLSMSEGVMHSVLAERRHGENETIHASRPRERRWALIKTWVFAAAMCIISVAPFTASENIQSASLGHRYPDHIWFISTYERGLIWIWRCLDSHASFLLMLYFYNSCLCHVRGGKKFWVTCSIRCNAAFGT